jgi:hypothetical protein
LINLVLLLANHRFIAKMPSSEFPSQTTTASSSSVEAQAQLIHAVSLVAVVLCPVILALPPRKLDVYSILLVSGTCVGGNQLAREYTGRSIVKRVQEIPASFGFGTLYSKRERESVWLGTDGARLKENNRIPIADIKNTSILEEIEKQKVASEAHAKPKWKEERDRKEIDAAQEGKGYGDLIMEQIWDVWNWGREKADDLKEKDEKVVKEEKKR